MKSLSSIPHEKSLTLLLKQGDYDAFSTLYQLYSLRLFGRIIRLVKSEAVAEEILQELFLKVWEKRDRIDPELNFKSFLFSIAQNMVYDHFRKMSLTERFRTEFFQTYAETYQHVEENVLFKQTHEQLMQTIRMLPPQCQKVFILFKLEGRSYKEICQMLKISKSTVNNHLTKANRLLKKQLPYYQNQVVMTCILLFKYL